jgi:hypothetical protein
VKSPGIFYVLFTPEERQLGKPVGIEVSTSCDSG